MALTTKERDELVQRYREWGYERLKQATTTEANQYESDAVEVMRTVLAEYPGETATLEPGLKPSDSGKAPALMPDVHEGSESADSKAVVTGDFSLQPHLLGHRHPDSTEAEAVMCDFFSFRTMLTGSLIKIVYILGLLGLTVGGVLFVALGLQDKDYGWLMTVLGVAILVLGNLFWRLTCEGCLLFFAIHERLVSIDKKTNDSKLLAIQKK